MTKKIEHKTAFILFWYTEAINELKNKLKSLDIKVEYPYVMEFRNTSKYGRQLWKYLKRKDMLNGEENKCLGKNLQ